MWLARNPLHSNYIKQKLLLLIKRNGIDAFSKKTEQKIKHPAAIQAHKHTNTHERSMAYN